jgi:glycosyltransferase involved in cell wall biosynthesis
VIVPTHNRCEVLARTITSLLAQEPVFSGDEIIVVDNASTDDTAGVVRRMQRELHPAIQYLYEERGGLHHSRHAGARAAQGEILVYIDDDILPDPKWLTSLIAIYGDAKVMAAGGRVLPLWEVEPPGWINGLPRDYLSLLDYGSATRPLRDGEGINGCNYSIRRSALFDAGGFHPDNFADPEMIWFRGDGEAGLTNILMRAGEKVMYVPDAIVWHRIPKERLTSAYFMRRGFAHGVENAYTFARRWKCSAWAILALSIGGFVMARWHQLRAAASSSEAHRGMRERVLRERYTGIAMYARRVARDPHLREHVLKASYLD